MLQIATNWYTTTNYPITLVATRSVRPHEDLLPHHVDHVTAMIAAANSWTHPIALEQSKLVLMDGHHRLEACKRLGIQYIPAVAFSYSDKRVALTSWNGMTVSAEDIIAAAAANRMLPAKTTRHIFTPPLGVSNICFEVLKATNAELRA